MYSYSVARANVLGLVVAVAACLGMKVAYVQVWGRSIKLADFPGGIPILLTAVLSGLVLHEFIHFGVARVLTARDPVVVSMGFRWRHLLPHVKVTGTVSAGHYRAISVAPLLVLGVVPAVAGLLFGNAMLALFGTIMIAGASGDVVVLFAIRSLSRHARVEDHPERIGCHLA